MIHFIRSATLKLNQQIARPYNLNLAQGYISRALREESNCDFA